MFKLIPEGKSRKKVIAGAITALVLLSFVSTGYLFGLTVSVRDRLSHHRWQVPSRVYSDSEVLFPGERINRDGLIRMLERRGYHYVSHIPKLPGEFIFRGSHLHVFLRDFTYPDHLFKGFLLTVYFRKGSIDKLLNEGVPIDLVMLEPLEIARLFGKKQEIRYLISYKQVPKYLISAIVTIEDKRFFHHRGLDWKGILRASWVDVKHGRVVQGGSTITQQLVKNYFLRPKRSFIRKAREVPISFIIEWLYSKEEILEMYMNEVYMGQCGGVSVNGLGEASRYYFGHDIVDITVAEAAMLAGLIRAPNHYSPFLYPGRAKKRRNLVLGKMLQAGVISKRDYEKALCQPVMVSKTPGLSKENLYYVDFLKRQLEEFYPEAVLTSEGLRIFTTLHTEFQDAAVRAVKNGLEEIEKKKPRLRCKKGSSPLQAAMIVIQPKTGEILAMVGGRNYTKSPFNRAVDAHRQPGSLFKPFVYLAALDTFTPASVIFDAPVKYKVQGKTWIPRNYDGRYHGKVTVRTSLEESLNAATVNLAMQVGLPKIISTAKGLGVVSKMDPYPSLALGAFEMTPLELARAYCVFANEGQAPFSLTLREVVNEQGKTEQRRSVEVKSACSPDKAYILTNILEGVIQYGTARKLKYLGIDFPCAGKTGTTTDYRDSWFVGYTSDLLALVWVGFDDNRNTHLSGATGAMIIWADFTKRVKKWMNPRPFLKPSGVVTRTIRVNVDWPPESLRPRVYDENFLAGTAPESTYRERREKGSSVGDFFKGIWRGLKGVFH